MRSLIIEIYRGTIELETTLLMDFKINLFEIESMISLVDLQFYSKRIISKHKERLEELKNTSGKGLGGVISILLSRLL